MAVFGRSLTNAIGTTPVVVSNAVPLGKTHTIHGLSVANITASPVTATVSITDGTTTIDIVNGLSIFPHDTLSVMGMEFKHNLLSGDSISVTADSVASLDVLFSYLEQ